MAERPVQITWVLPGMVTAICVVVIVASPVVAVLWFAGGGGIPSLSDWGALRFTLLQASLSGVLSVILAIPVSRALARRRFPGREALITLLGVPFILPVTVGVLGLLEVFGRNGIVSYVLGLVGLPPLSIYGLHGVLLAHVYFNLPLATRIILQGWQDIPAERFRLAEALGMGPAQVFRFLEWPMLRATAPGAFISVFGVCVSSFATVLMLGGGPKSTTLELAIYQAFRFEFDLGRAATLAAVQAVLVGLIVWVWLHVARRKKGPGVGLDRVVRRRDSDTRLLKGYDFLVLSLTAAFLLLPLVLIVGKGVLGLPQVPASVWTALKVSVTIALVSTALSVSAGLLIAMTSLRYKWAEVLAMLGFAVSPLVLGTGLFLMINPWIKPTELTFAVTAVVNALMILPFATRVTTPAVQWIEADYGRLADALGMSGWARLRLLILPRAKRVLGLSAGIAAALSMGDLGVVTLFADPSQATLPLQMYRLMGAYRMDAAAGAALILLSTSLLLFWIFDRLGRGNVDA